MAMTEMNYLKVEGGDKIEDLLVTYNETPVQIETQNAMYFLRIANGTASNSAIRVGYIEDGVLTEYWSATNYSNISIQYTSGVLTVANNNSTYTSMELLIMHD